MLPISYGEPIEASGQVRRVRANTRSPFGAGTGASIVGVYVWAQTSAANKAFVVC